MKVSRIVIVGVLLCPIGCLFGQETKVITGMVRDPQDRPIEGATLRICPMGGREVTSGVGGRFEIPLDPRFWGRSGNPAMFLVGRYKTDNLAAAVEIPEDTRTMDIRLRPGMTFFGKVIDPNGKGIPNAKVQVFLWSGNWGSSIETPSNLPQTDAQGAFEIRAIPTDQSFKVHAHASGFGTRMIEAVVDDAENNRLDVGVLDLPVANLSVSGVVVDVNDRPVADAQVYVDGENQPFGDTRSDASGRFTIRKICAGRIQISADTTGQVGMRGSVWAESGAADVKVVISKRSTSGRSKASPIPSLQGKPLPDLKDLGLSLADVNDRPLLVCFADIEQRPSRQCLSNLAKKTSTLSDKGVTVMVVQVSRTDLNPYQDWLKTAQISLPIHAVEADFEAGKAAWGVKGLPWLILTDRGHKVTAEGFSVGELDKVLGK